MHLTTTFWKKRFFTYFQLCCQSVSRWSLRVIHHHYGMLSHVIARFYHNFSFFLTCRLAVGRLSVTCRSTVGWQLTDSRPTGFFGGALLHNYRIQAKLPFWQVPSSGFRGKKYLEVFLLAPGWDAIVSPLQGYPQLVNSPLPIYKHLGTKRHWVNCLTHEHNTISPVRAQTQTTEASTPSMRPTTVHP